LKGKYENLTNRVNLGIIEWLGFSMLPSPPGKISLGDFLFEFKFIIFGYG
jgi:hypothetical protein